VENYEEEDENDLVMDLDYLENEEIPEIAEITEIDSNDSENDSESENYFEAQEENFQNSDTESIDSLVAFVKEMEIPRNAAISCLSATLPKDCPNTYEEATSSPESKEWKFAMDREMESIRKAETYIVKEIPKNIRKMPVKNRWVFTKKYDKNGKVKKIQSKIGGKRLHTNSGNRLFRNFRTSC